MPPTIAVTVLLAVSITLTSLVPPILVTYTRVPAGLTVIPRGPLATGTVAMIRFVAVSTTATVLFPVLVM